MIAHQKQIRDAQKVDHPVPTDFSGAEVREISYAEAKEVILRYEWLGTWERLVDASDCSSTVNLRVSNALVRPQGRAFHTFADRNTLTVP